MGLLEQARQILAGRPPAEAAGARLVVAVSGGPDSLALLHLLARGGLYPAALLTAAHLDHALRPGSAAEAEQVARVATTWGVGWQSERVDVAGLARDRGLSLEEAGRTARYAFLARIARQVGAGAVLTGHTADDQAETILMHLLRGSGTSGLRGMQPLSPLPGAPELTLMRPLLSSSRAEVLAYCAEHALRPIEDPSNADPIFFRNRLRHELLPMLASYNPQIRERLRNLGQVASADQALVNEAAGQALQEIALGNGAGWLKLDQTGWAALPLSLRRATLRRALTAISPADVEAGFRTLEQAREVAETGRTGASATLPGGAVLTVDYKMLTLTSAGQRPPITLPQLSDDESRPLPVPGRLPLAGGWLLEANPAAGVDPALLAANRDPWLAFVSLPAGERLVVRPRRRGERFQPLGLGGASSSVKEVMIDRKLPAALRPRWPLVATAGRLVWLVGHHLDERARVTDTGSPLVRLRALREAD